MLAIPTVLGLTLLAYVASPASTGGSVNRTLAYQNQYYFDGYLIGYVVLAIYTLGNVAAFMLYWNQRRSEFNWILHGLFPLLSTLGMIAVLLFSLNIIGGDPLTFQPGSASLPPAPFNIAVVFVAVWIVVACALVVYMRLAGHEDWIAKAAEAASERPATPEEIAEAASEW